MENKNKGLVVLVIFLIVCVLGLLTYIIFDKTKNSEDSKVVDNNSKEESKLLKTDTYVYKINNKNLNIMYEYSYRDSKEYYKDYEEDHDYDYDKRNEQYVYHEVFVKIYLDNKELEDVEIPLYYDTKGIDSNELMNQIEPLSLDNINILKGTDKDYLVISIKPASYGLDVNTAPIIINDSGKILYTLEFNEFGTIWAEDENSLFYDKKNILFFIEDNKLYYLSLNSHNQEGTYVQENYITIENDKVIFNKGNVYIGGGAGAI